MSKVRNLPCRVGCDGKKGEGEAYCPKCYFSLSPSLRSALYTDKSGQSHRQALKILRGGNLPPKMTGDAENPFSDIDTPADPDGKGVGYGDL